MCYLTTIESLSPLQVRRGEEEPIMTYQIQPLTFDPTQLTGLSEKLIVSHYENNYGGAVKR